MGGTCTHFGCARRVFYPSTTMVYVQSKFFYYIQIKTKFNIFCDVVRILDNPKSWLYDIFLKSNNDGYMSGKLALAITNIGDLLLKGILSRAQNDKPMEGISLRIPNYQRPYKWTSKNVHQFLDDISEARRENKEIYRLGTLILHKDPKGYNIVDGQQRTITLSLLMHAFFQILDSHREKIDFLDQELTNNAHNQYNISKNFRELQRFIKNLSNIEQEDLFLYVKNRCELIVVVTDDISEAFQFFDSQNARGKKLFPHDLLKAYHLREMNHLDSIEAETIVQQWEKHTQQDLADLFSQYLYRIREWIHGNRTYTLNEHNIHKFKGITHKDNFPYAQYYKGAYAYAQSFNQSSAPFVTGSRNLKLFQLNAPIIAGKAFFEFTNHYYKILKDIQDNDRYIGDFIKGNDIVKTLELKKFKEGTGNRITRQLFDSALLLYVDRFCSEKPNHIEIALFEKFVVLAFIWAYSLRAQYQNLGWSSAIHFVLGTSKQGTKNSFNIYKSISEIDSPKSLFNSLSYKLQSLPVGLVKHKIKEKPNKGGSDIPQNYLYFFDLHQYLEK